MPPQAINAPSSLTLLTPLQISAERVRGMGMGALQVRPHSMPASPVAWAWLNQRRRLPPGSRHSAARGTSASRLPTARMVAKSNEGAGVEEANSSRRSPRTVTWVNPQARAASFKKARFFATGSSRATAIPGKTIFKARPGKPAPLPMSSKSPRSRMCRARKRLSPKCRVRHSSGSRMAVRLIFSFHRRSK